MTLDKQDIRRTALELVASNGRRVATRLAKACGLSRQVANGYLQRLTEEGLLVAEGSTRARVHGLKSLLEVNRSFSREGLDEDVVWREALASSLAELPENVRGIWQYAFTELVNNAIDHSGSEEVTVGLQRNALYTDGWVSDVGEGIFLKIQRAFDLYDAREAILELAKGKLTTAPENHSGEGIFFTSKMVDSFDIVSGRLHFSRDQHAFEGLLAERDESTPGTLVMMRLANESPRTMTSVFDEFSDPEEYTFDKTVVPLLLAQHEGQKLVSRSQAKRVAHRFERFKRVVLDFEGVTEIGQAFADEIFRVFATAHPEVRLTPMNTSPAVANMVRRALSAQSAGME